MKCETLSWREFADSSGNTDFQKIYAKLHDAFLFAEMVKTSRRQWIFSSFGRYIISLRIKSDALVGRTRPQALLKLLPTFFQVTYSRYKNPSKVLLSRARSLRVRFQVFGVELLQPGKFRFERTKFEYFLSLCATCISPDDSAMSEYLHKLYGEVCEYLHKLQDLLSWAHIKSPRGPCKVSMALVQTVKRFPRVLIIISSVRNKNNHHSATAICKDTNVKFAPLSSQISNLSLRSYGHKKEST